MAITTAHQCQPATITPARLQTPLNRDQALRQQRLKARLVRQT